jgi:hypothetical protein
MEINVRKILFLLFAAVMLSGTAYAQAASAVVVSSCGTPPVTYAAGQTYPQTQDTTGKLCNNTAVTVSTISGTVTANQGSAGASPWPVQQASTAFVYSAANSTTAQLAANATFTGTIETIINQQTLSLLLVSDQPGTLTVYQYIDAAGTQVASTWTFPISAGVGFSRALTINGNYLNLTFKNTGASTTTTLAINTYYGTLPATTQLGNGPIALNEMAGVSLGAPSAYGTSPGAVQVQGVNAFVTGVASTYPTGAVPITASATGTTLATTATLAGTSGKTTYLCGLSIRANATAAATGNATVTGTITGTLNFTQWTAPLASGLGITEPNIGSQCIPASAVNTGIAVISAAPGSGGTVSVTAWGYQL